MLETMASPISHPQSRLFNSYQPISARESAKIISKRETGELRRFGAGGSMEGLGL